MRQADISDRITVGAKSDGFDKICRLEKQIRELTRVRNVEATSELPQFGAVAPTQEIVVFIYPKTSELVFGGKPVVEAIWSDAGVAVWEQFDSLF